MPPVGDLFYLTTQAYSSPSSSKARASASRTRSSMALTGTAIPRSCSADSLLDPRWNQLPTPGVVSEALVPTASSSGAVSEPYTSIRPPRVQCPCNHTYDTPKQEFRVVARSYNWDPNPPIVRRNPRPNWYSWNRDLSDGFRVDSPNSENPANCLANLVIGGARA